jgi:hypothetical protein
MKYLRSLKEKTKNLKSAPSTNVISYDDDVILLCKDTIDNETKICETLNEEMICCVKVGTHQINTISSGWNKKEVECYYRNRELY